MKLLLLLVAIVCLFASSNAAILGRTLAECRTVAATFDNTCQSNGTAYASVSAVPSKTFSATVSDNTYCIGTVSGGVCSWEKRMCVTCRESAGKVYIRVQSDGFPNRLFFTPPTKIVAKDYDFEVLFNPEVPASPIVSVSTVAEVNQAVCSSLTDVTKTVPSAYSYTKKTTANIDTLSGISLSGIPYFNQLSIDNVDPFFPTDNRDVEKLSTCMAHPESQGALHYHSASICEINKPTTIGPCSKDSTCASGPITTVLKGFPNTTPQIIGITKSGHVIYSPRKDSSGNYIKTNIDACNGVTLTEGGKSQYAYYATNTFPYILGCFGPANVATVFPTCTTNPL